MGHNTRKIISIFTVLVLLSSYVILHTVSAQESSVIAKFSFDQKNTQDKTLDITYGGNADDGYHATNGVLKDNAVLHASITGTKNKKLEWSNFDGSDGNIYKDSDGETLGAAPVMAANEDHPWSNTTINLPYFLITADTTGFSNITFSAELGGSKKGAKNFGLSYSINGTEFVEIDAAHEISKNKTMQKAFDNILLPEDAANIEKLYLKVYALDNTTINNGLLSDNTTGGENAINNICIKGTPLSGEYASLPSFEVVRAVISDNKLKLDMKNVDDTEKSAVNIACLYNKTELVKVFTNAVSNIVSDKRFSISYDISDLDFDAVRVFNLSDMSNIKPLGVVYGYTASEIMPTPTPTPAPEYSNEPQYQDIPRVDITGDITDISRENWKNVTVSYQSATESFTSYASIKWQGRSSVTQGYPKYNYSIKLFSDDAYSVKDVHQFKTWLPAHNYCLKANWIDSTHARNIVNARLAATMQKEPLPTGASGLIDGFPIHVYLNDEDQGIYTWNIPKKGWTFGMDSDNPNHIVFGAEQQKGACLFENLSSSDNDWEMVYPDESDTARDKLNRLITFVKDSSVEEFKANFDQYLNFDSLANYYVFSHIMAHTDGYAKNMLLATFDGNVWYTSLYDMDSTWGLHWQGKKIIAADALYNPNNSDAAMYSTSLLWSKFEQAFGDEIYQRYTQLRANELTDEKIIEAYQYFIDGVGQDLYDLDESVWEGKSSKHKYIPSRYFRLEQIKTFMQERSAYTDAWMEGLRTNQ